MRLTPWLHSFCKPASWSKRKRRTVASCRPWSAPIETLERRTLPSTVAVFIDATATLAISTDSGSDVQVQVDETGHVLVNGGVPQTGPLASAAVGAMTVLGDAGDNTIDLRGVDAASFSSLQSVFVSAGNGNDTVYGSSTDDVLLGRRGRDLLFGGGGDDTLNGQGGRDTLGGGTGDDLLRGGGGPDALAGGQDHDTLRGQAGDDTLLGSQTEDKLSGGVGNDLIETDVAEVTTDRPDYQPADTAVIDATGFRWGETIEFQVLHIDGKPNTGAGHDAWFVTDGGAGDLDGALDGNVRTTWFVDPDDSLNSTFELTALGHSSGLSAATTFTDGQARHEHWRNVTGQWSTGSVNATNSDYREGETIPDRLEIVGLDPDSSADNVVRLDIIYDFFRDTEYTFDFLTTYDRTETVDEFLGSQTTLTTGSSVALLEIPDDPTHAFDDAVRNDEATQHFTIYYDGTFLNASVDGGPTLTNGSTYENTISIRIDTDASQFALFWGGHLALTSDWSTVDEDPAGNAIEARGAGFVSGGPFHMRVEGLIDEDDDGMIDNGETTLTTGDLSVQSAAIAPPDPAVDLQKLASVQTVDMAGEAVTYSYRVENTGNVTLTSVSLTDDVEGTLMLTDTAGNGVDVLAPGDVETATSMHLVTQAEFDAGSLTNTATVSGRDPDDSEVSDTDMQTVTFLQDPALTIVKSFTANDDADGSGNVSLGDTLTYTFTVTNTGDVTLTGVTVDDPLTGGMVTLDTTTLAPGEEATGTATYVVMQSDVDAGAILNTATADSDQTGEQTDDESVEVPQDPALTIVKSFTGNDDADSSGDISLGDTLTYTFTVTNTGDLTLTGVTVDDPLTGGMVTLDTTTLAPGEQATGTGTYLVTQADVDAGQILNTATADSDQTGEQTDDETVDVPQDPALTIVKSFTENDDADGSGDVSLGDTLTYTFTVTNAGDVTLTGVTVDDPLTGGMVTLDATTLAPGEQATGTGMYIVTQSDVDAGQILNTATADSDQTGEETDDETVDVPQDPALTIVKSFTENDDADGSGDVSLGDTLTYTFTVTNTGDVTLTGVTIDDPLTGGMVTLDATTLAPGEQATGTATYLVTQIDVNAGMIFNTATADSDQTGEETDEETVDVPHHPAIAIEKTATPDSGVTADDTITYTYVVTNEGNIPLINVTVTDDNGTPDDADDDFHPQYIGGDDNGNDQLDLDEAWTYEAEIIVTMQHVVDGEIENIATATAMGSPLVEDTDDAIVLVNSDVICDPLEDVGYGNAIVHDGHLCIVGTPDNDEISVAQFPDGRLRVAINTEFLQMFTISETGIIFIWGFEGQDWVVVEQTVMHDVFAFGGSGDDIIHGAQGNDVLLGEEGNDLVTGGWEGRDILIGGPGADILEGGDPLNVLPADDSDLLITGSLSDPVDLLLVHMLWNSAKDYDMRVADLMSGGMIDLPSQVDDDAVADRAEGGRDLDWFLLDPGQDLHDREIGEVVTEI